MLSTFVSPFTLSPSLALGLLSQPAWCRSISDSFSPARTAGSWQTIWAVAFDCGLISASVVMSPWPKSSARNVLREFSSWNLLGSKVLSGVSTCGYKWDSSPILPGTISLVTHSYSNVHASVGNHSYCCCLGHRSSSIELDRTRRITRATHLFTNPGFNRQDTLREWFNSNHSCRIQSPASRVFRGPVFSSTHDRR